MKFQKAQAVLVLQDGTAFWGRSFGADLEKAGEVVFNTSLTGYQEILTDPSYSGQIVTMTCPMIGNYGVNSQDEESKGPAVAGFVVKEYVEAYSNFRAQESLADYLKRFGIPGLEGIDTRALVRHIRAVGAMPGLLSTQDLDLKRLKKQAKDLPSMNGMDLVKDVTCARPYSWKKGTQFSPWLRSKRKKTELKSRRVVALDFGIKQNILRHLVDIGAEVTVVPAQSTAEEILAYQPEGVFLSNGPGDPAAVDYAITTVQQLIGQVPIFGICLGHQILALASGAESYKLKFGHRGANQPVKNLATGHVEITSQNHGFAIDEVSLLSAGKLSHRHLNDNTVAGFENVKKRFFGVQYHPEASPGPHDSHYLFEKFRTLMDEG